MTESAPLVTFSDVAWIPPGRDKPLFSELNFVANPGDVVVLTSHLGGGKSSALRMAVGLDQPSFGRVTLCGDDPSRTHLRVGYVADEGALLANLTLRDNLVLPLRWLRDPPPDEVDRRARESLALFGVFDIPNVPPAFAPTNLRRFVSLARAMILDPAVLVLDDPSDDFDPESAEEMWKHLVEIATTRQIAVLAAATIPPNLPGIRQVQLSAATTPSTRTFSAEQRRTAASSVLTTRRPAP